MAKKVLLQDWNKNEILPITRGELILDSSGKEAFHSIEFLATTSLPGLMSNEDKTKLDSLVIDASLSTTSTNPVQNKVITTEINSIKNSYLKSATVNNNTLTIVDQSNNSLNFYNATYNTFSKETSEGKGGNLGLVPIPNYNSGSNNRYLREDGTWVKPDNTTYTFEDGTNGFTVTSSSGNEKFINVIPNIANNVIYSGTLVDKQVAIFDGTSGTIKASGYTIASNVPSDAKFTDTTYSNGEGLSLSNYTFALKKSSTDKLGGIKIAKNNTYTVSTHTSNLSLNITTVGKYYGIELDSTGKAFVYVPWFEYSLMTESEANTGTATTARTISAKVLHDKIKSLLPSVMTGATSNDDGESGLVPKPVKGNLDKYLRGDGSWETPLNNKVTLTNTTNNSEYRVLFSENANDTTSTESARKSTNLKFNPSTGTLTATTFNGNLDWSKITNKPTSFTPSAHNHPTNQIDALTGYSKAEGASDLATTDTLNTALGKLEYKADYAYDWIISVTASDTDEYVNKWSEIVGFLDSVKEGTDILDEFVTRKTTQTITGAKTFSGGVTLSCGLNITGTNPITWNDGTYHQRIQTTDDSNTNTNLFEFQQSKDTGATWESLFTIKDNGHVVAAKFITTGGTSSQFVKGDGSLDNNTYVTGGPYLPLSGGKMDTSAFIAWNTNSADGDLSDWSSIKSNYGLRIISYANESTKGTAPCTYATGLHVRGRYGFLLASEGGNTSNTFYIKNIHNDKWNELIHSNNISSLSVNYAASAGKVAWANITGKPSFFSGNYNDLTNKPDLSNYVTLDGTQTITGFKTFTNYIYVSSGCGIVDSGGTGILGVYPTTWTGVPTDGSAVGLGALGKSLYIRTSGNNLYHYRNDTDNSYNILDSGNWSSYITLPTIPSISITNSGTGNAVTSITASGHTLTVTKGYTFATSGHTHYYLTTPGDKRSEATTPSSYSHMFAFLGLKNNSTIGSPSSDIYSYLVGLRGWSDSSGGNSWELAFNNTGIYTRNGASSWGDWKKIAFISDLTWANITGKPTIPTIPSLSLGTTTGSGNAVTSISVSGHTITLNKGTTFLTAHSIKTLTFSSGTFASKTYNGSADETVYVPSNFNHIGDASNLYINAGTVTRRIIVQNTKNNLGYISRASIGLSNPANQFSPVIIGVGTNDAGTTYTDYYFHVGGSITDSKGNTYAKTSDIPTKTSQLDNDSGFITSRGYIGTTAVQATSGNLALTGINNITTPSLGFTITTPSGNIQIGPQNTSGCHIYTNRDLFYFNKPIYYWDGSSSHVYISAYNYTSYTPILNSSSTHATKNSVIYAPTSAGTSGYVLKSNGSGAPSWTSPSNLSVGYAELAGSATTAGTAHGLSKSFTVFGVSFNGAVNTTVDMSTLIGVMGTGDSNITDSTHILTSHVNGFNSSGNTTTIYKRTANYLWNYIKGKIDATYSHSKGYIGTTAVSSASNAGQNITGIGNITPNTTKVSYLGNSSLYWKEVTSNIFRSYGGSSTWAAFYLNDSGNTVFENSSGTFYINSKSLISLKAASNLVVLGSGTAAFYPNTTLTLGTSSLRWNYVYATHLNAEGGKFYTDANGAYWTSDARLKTNIVKARNLDIADLLVEFDWKDSGYHSWGYIAQDLLEILPEAVSYSEDTDRYSVNYNVAHSAAIASLTARIKELEEKLKKYGIL